MADEIKGTAVLDDRDPAHECLFVVCVAGDPAKSLPFISRIAIRRRGQPHDPDQPEWEYDEQGAQLHVTPSLLVRSTRPIPGSPDNEPFEMFHSSGDWRVAFVRWSSGTPETHPWEHCREINEAILQGNF